MTEDRTVGRNMDKNYQWRKEKLKRFDFFLNRETEKDVCEWLEKQPNRRQYLISLIKGDMNENKHPTDEEN